MSKAVLILAVVCCFLLVSSSIGGGLYYFRCDLDLADCPSPEPESVPTPSPEEVADAYDGGEDLAVYWVTGENTYRTHTCDKFKCLKADGTCPEGYYVGKCNNSVESKIPDACKNANRITNISGSYKYTNSDGEDGDDAQFGTDVACIKDIKMNKYNDARLFSIDYFTHDKYKVNNFTLPTGVTVLDGFIQIANNYFARVLPNSPSYESTSPDAINSQKPASDNDYKSYISNINY